MQIEITKAGPEDAESIVSVHVKTWKVSYQGLIADEVIARKQVTLERIAQMRRPIVQGLVWVAKVNGQLVGFAGLSEKSQIPEAEIAVFYVLPEFQGQGIGANLFAAVCAELKNQNFCRVIVWTMEKAPSLKFYQKLGGRLSGLTDSHYDQKIVQLIWDL